MILVLIGKDFVLEGSRQKIENKQVPGTPTRTFDTLLKHLKFHSATPISAMLLDLRSPGAKMHGATVAQHDHVFESG